MFVKPAPHPENPDAQRRVRIPHTHALLANDGEEVPDNAFWLRRVMHGDVVETERPKPAVPPVETPPEVRAEAPTAETPPAVHIEASGAEAQLATHVEAPLAAATPPAPAVGTGA